jgi:hypothetical protein
MILGQNVAQQKVCTHCISMQSLPCSNKSLRWTQAAMYNMRARTSRRVPPAGLRCAASPSPRLRLFRLVSCPVCGFGASGSASLCVA